MSSCRCNVPGDEVRARGGVQDGRRAGASRRHPRGSRPRSAARDGLDGQPGFERHAGGRRPGSRRAFHRLGARTRPDRRAGRPAVAPRSREATWSSSCTCCLGKTPVGGPAAGGPVISPTHRRPARPCSSSWATRRSTSPRARRTYADRGSCTSCRSDATVLSVYPHAHYSGNEMTVRARCCRPARTKTSDSHPAVELSLAAGLPLRDADRAARAARAIVMRVYLRQIPARTTTIRAIRRGASGPGRSRAMRWAISASSPAAERRGRRHAHGLVRGACRARSILAGAQMLAGQDPSNAANHARGRHRALSRLRRFAERGAAALERAVQLDPGSDERAQPSAGVRSRRSDDRARPSSSSARPRRWPARRAPALQLRAGVRMPAIRRPRSVLDAALAFAPSSLRRKLLGFWCCFRAGVWRTCSPEGLFGQLFDSAAAHSDYGGALAAAGGRLAPAEVDRRALAIDPAHAGARQPAARAPAPGALICP